MKEMFPLLPEQASTYASRVDPLFYSLVGMTAVLTLGIFASVVFMAVRYRWKKGENRLSKPFENPALEITWSVIPGIVGVGIFAWGALLYSDYRNTPDGALDIDVVGKRWMWKVQHANGKREINEIHVPLGRPVALTLTSQDVLHSFYVPAFRVKQDVVPGRFTKLWFEATKVGSFPLFCAEYCGTEHSLMRGTVHVMEPDDYVAWLGGGVATTRQSRGEFLFQQRGCAACHSPASGSRGPDLAGLFGTEVELRTGDIVLADEEYLRESIMSSPKKVKAGYAPLMPAFQNQLKQDELMDLIVYIKSLGGEEESNGITID